MPCAAHCASPTNWCLHSAGPDVSRPTFGYPAAAGPSCRRWRRCSPSSGPGGPGHCASVILLEVLFEAEDI